MRLQKILMPTDFSDCANSALTHALFLAQHLGAELHILHVVVLHAEDPFDPAAQFPDPDEIYRRMQEIAAGEMKDLVADRPTDRVAIKTVQRRAISAAPAIADYAEELGVDLVVMGAHGRRGFRRFLLGSVAEEVVRTADCPVLTLRGEERGPELEKLERIVVPFDFSDPAKSALATAKELAVSYGARLDVVHVIEPPVDPGVFVPLHDRRSAFAYSELAAEVREHLGPAVEELVGTEVEVDVEILDGNTAERIAEHAESVAADLIVISTQGLTGLRRFLLGSVTEKVVRSADCPVLTLKTSG